MRYHLSAVGATAVISLCSSLAAAAVHEKLHGVPHGWSPDGEPNSDDVFTLEMGLTPKHFDKMVSRLYQVSDPAHKEYGQHMDRDELHSMIAPASVDHDAVISWLRSSGARKIKSDGMYVDFQTTVGNANKQFNTTFRYFKKDGVRKLRTTEYHIPDALSSKIDVVVPTTYFGKTSAQDVHVNSRKIGSPDDYRTLVSSACNGFITPGCLNQLYNIGEYVADPSYGSNIGFGSFLNQSAQYSDLKAYEGFYQIPAQTFSVELIHGGVNNQSAAIADVGEANLDVENIVGVAHPLPVREYITGGSPPFNPDINEPTAADNQNEPYFAYYRYLLSQPNSNLPQVISNSYGDVEETVPKKFAMAVCNQIAQMGMRGISILESSGDAGVGAGCKSNINGKPRFEPTFPASCPYVTAIGGTQSVNPEIAWTGSAGGFSDYFTRPSYQQAAVTTYLNRYIPAATLSYYQPYFSQNGRAFPDISAHSLSPDYLIVYKGDLYTSGGTSAAAPVIAGIIGFLNDARLRQGKSSLGFLNPMLYSTGLPGIKDVTAGGTVGCNGVNAQTGQNVTGAKIIPYASWNATVGWATGLGIPDFGKLISILAPSS